MSYPDVILIRYFTDTAVNIIWAAKKNNKTKKKQKKTTKKTLDRCTRAGVGTSIHGAKPVLSMCSSVSTKP